MKILVVCQHYYPEPFRITDICEELVKRGHEVTVITGTPNYPMGKIYAGYEKGKKRDEIRAGVKIHRCFEIGRRHGTLFRFLNYYSFAISSKRYIKRMKEKFDVVFANQLSPIMMVNGAVAYKKKQGAKLVMYVMDLWPESLIVGGVKRGSLLYKYYHKVSKKIYRAADKLLVTSKLFKDYLSKEFGIDKGEIGYLPQYAEDLFSEADCKKEPDGSVDLLFAGNIGAAQSLITVCKAATKTQDLPVCYHIVGDGIELENCKAYCAENGLSKVLFYGRRPLNEMSNFYAKADGMLLTLVKNEVLSLTLPGKAQTYMAAGKPVIGAIDGAGAELIKEANCGYVSEAENAEALTKNIRAFFEDVKTGKAIEFGANARLYYEKHFAKENFLTNLEKAFEE
jgi:glycosyltransferase involved in cell wall biosynthesis